MVQTGRISGAGRRWLQLILFIVALVLIHLQVTHSTLNLLPNEETINEIRARKGLIRRPEGLGADTSLENDTNGGQEPRAMGENTMHPTEFGKPVWDEQFMSYMWKTDYAHYPEGGDLHHDDQPENEQGNSWDVDDSSSMVKDILGEMTSSPDQALAEYMAALGWGSETLDVFTTPPRDEQEEPSDIHGHNLSHQNT